VLPPCRHGVIAGGTVQFCQPQLAFAQSFIIVVDNLKTRCAFMLFILNIFADSEPRPIVTVSIDLIAKTMLEDPTSIDGDMDGWDWC
jgi:hypothetical protein